MTEVAAALHGRDRPSGPVGRLVAPAVFVASIALCLAAAALVLALLPSPQGEHHTISESLAIIGKSVWERVLLPRSPRVRAGYRNWIQTLQTATPILLTGLAITAAFRANVLNIGTQGQYVLGAIAGAAAGIYLPAGRGMLIPLLLLAAMAAGALLAAISAALERWRNVPVVLSTLLLNFVALEFLRYVLQGPMRAAHEDGTLLDPQTRELPDAARLPDFLTQSNGQGLHVGFLIAVVAAVALSFLLRRTTFGFRLRVVGQNPDAARFAGINVARVSFATLALSGALAGLAGAIQVAGIPPYVLFPDVGTDGLGFTGIAVALLGRLSPVGVIFSALFFGLLNTAFRALEQSPLQIHSVTAQAVQGMLIIAVLVVSSPEWGRILRPWRPRGGVKRG